jgi:hypothetical protein
MLASSLSGFTPQFLIDRALDLKARKGKLKHVSGIALVDDMRKDQRIPSIFIYDYGLEFGTKSGEDLSFGSSPLFVLNNKPNWAFRRQTASLNAFEPDADAFHVSSSLQTDLRLSSANTPELLSTQSAEDPDKGDHYNASRTIF